MRRCKLKKCGELFEPQTPNQVFSESICRITFFNRKREKKERQKVKDGIKFKSSYNSMTTKENFLSEMIGHVASRYSKYI